MSREERQEKKIPTQQHCQQRCFLQSPSLGLQPHLWLGGTVPQWHRASTGQAVKTGLKVGKWSEPAQQPQQQSKTSCQDAAVGALWYPAAPSSSLGAQGGWGKLGVQGSPVEGAASQEGKPQPPAGGGVRQLVRFFSEVKTRTKQTNTERSKWHRRVQLSLKMMGKKAVLMSEMPTQRFCCWVKQAGRC